jgi:hypothetical protein
VLQAEQLAEIGLALEARPGGVPQLLSDQLVEPLFLELGFELFVDLSAISALMRSSWSSSAASSAVRSGVTSLSSMGRLPVFAVQKSGFGNDFVTGGPAIPAAVPSIQNAPCK